MTPSERMVRVSDIRIQMLAKIRKDGGSVAAGDFMRKFCKDEKVDRTLAEVALSALLTRGDIVPDRDLKLMAS